jgi:DNA polymerase III delta prime subunit
LFFKDAGSTEPFRLFDEYFYQAGTWDYPRSIIVKAERLPDHRHIVEGKENTRYIVTNLLGTPQYLYEEIYCARGEMENRIKEMQLMLFSDRTSCPAFRANRFRLFLSSCAYVLMETIRRKGLRGTSLERAQCGTIRKTLFKIAAVVTVSVRRILFSLPTSCPVQDLWLRVYDRLRFNRLYEVLPLPSS